MSTIALFCLLFVILFHALAFVGEAFLWMRPALHRGMIRKVNPGLDMDPADQARVTRILMINQGVYNLMIALGGIAALMTPGAAGTALATYVFAFAIAAGATLAFTTVAFVGAALQAIPALIGLWFLLS